MVRVLAPQRGGQPLPAFRSAPVDEVEEESMRLPRQKLEALGEPQTLGPELLDPIHGCSMQPLRTDSTLWMEGQI